MAVNVNEMDTKEKSLVLAGVMNITYQLFSDNCYFYQQGGELFVRVYPFGWDLGMTEDEVMRKWFPDLYKPEHMALAWGVLNWAYRENLERFDELIRTDLLWYLYESPAEEAQRLWLDKVLELAIEAGLVEP